MIFQVNFVYVTFYINLIDKIVPKVMKINHFFLGSSLSVDKWLSEVDGQTFEDWQKRSIRVVTKRPEWKKPEAKTIFLQEKYFKKWYDKTLRRQASLSFDMTSSSSW